MIGMTEGKRKKGRSHMRWKDEIRDASYLTIAELREVTRDLIGWTSSEVARYLIGWRQLIVNVTRSTT